MKKITGLNDKPEHFDTIPEGSEHLIPLIRTMLVKQLATAVPIPNQAENAITLVELALKIKNVPVDFLEIEDADFIVFQAAVLANKAEYNGFYQGQLCLRLKAWANKESAPPK